MKTTLAALLALAAALPASAAVNIIDFEDVESFASIGNHYSAQGVSFGGDLLGLRNDDGLGPYFSNSSTPVGAMFVASDLATETVVNFLQGFTGFWFDYASPERVLGAVQVWSGADGTGDLLASFTLGANATEGCSDTPYCHFDREGGNFAGTARSVSFASSAYLAAFDNLQAVPEPATGALVALAVAGLALRRRRQG